MHIVLKAGVVSVLVLCACGGETQKSDSSGSASGAPTGKSSASARTSVATAAPSGRPSATPAAPGGTASASASAATQPADAPASLATMFDGGPDGAVKMAKPATFGKATLGLPEGWKLGGNWDSVDTLTKSDGSATIVVIRLEPSEALLDANVATWVKVPFSTTEVKWEPREAGKLGAAHLDAKLAKGTGKIGKDDAEFWQAAVGDGKKFPLIVVGGVKKSADAATRAELVASMRSIEWK